MLEVQLSKTIQPGEVLTWRRSRPVATLASRAIGANENTSIRLATRRRAVIKMMVPSERQQQDKRHQEKNQQQQQLMSQTSSACSIEPLASRLETRCRQCSPAVGETEQKMHHNCATSLSSSVMYKCAGKRSQFSATDCTCCLANQDSIETKRASLSAGCLSGKMAVAADDCLVVMTNETNETTQGGKINSNKTDTTKTKKMMTTATKNENIVWSRTSRSFIGEQSCGALLLPVVIIILLTLIGKFSNC